MGLSVLLFAAQSWGWSASGSVKTTTGTALAGVAVSVKDSSKSLMATTDASGKFSISTSGISSRDMQQGFSLRHDGADLLVGSTSSGELELSLLDLSGQTMWTGRAQIHQGVARFHAPTTRAVSHAIMAVRSGSEVLYRAPVLMGSEGWREAPSILARALAAFPVLLFQKTGFADTTFPMTAESQTAIAVAMREIGVVPPVGDTFVEDHRGECTIPAMPAVSALANIPNLPDPFKMMDGTPVTTKAQWTCRREEIAAMLEKYVHGEKPRKPEKVTGSFSGGKLTVSVTDKGKTVSFAVTITKPSGTGPFPALIGWDGGNIGGYSSLPVAKISYPITTIASEGGGRGKGVFYDLYGSSAAASELMAHAWGLSRIIDALLVTPEAGIDAHRLAVTGCSRWGKSATISGSFDQRVKLVIPQESGSGGVASWRIIPTFSDAQPIASTYNEAYWTRQDFLTNFGSAIGKLPADHHEMIGMIAPRGLLILDNSIAWLGPQATYGSAMAAKEIFTALGATESITYSSVGGHTHCSQPGTQDHWVASYMKKFLLGQTGEAAKMEAPAEYKFDKAKWITWTTPALP